MGVIERAADVVRRVGCITEPFATEVAQALADADLLVADHDVPFPDCGLDELAEMLRLANADRAVLDAADQWLVAVEVGEPWQQSTAGLEAAVRARREAQP